MPTAASPVTDAREQIARLKERLTATQARTGVIEPKRTAAAVREVVDGLRDRLEASARERSELAEGLDAARATLARTVAELERERRAREVFEAQAEERRRIADDAVAEAEALAAERDQVLGELAQHRRLEAEQTSLLTQVEAALAERDAERESAARELAETRDVVNLRAAEIADLGARLRDEAAARGRAEAQCRDLEAEIARLSEAREALETIEAALGHRRGNPRDDKR
jgi:chromosome segregation ATPase